MMASTKKHVIVQARSLGDWIFESLDLSVKILPPVYLADAPAVVV